MFGSQPNCGYKGRATCRSRILLWIGASRSSRIGSGTDRRLQIRLLSRNFWANRTPSQRRFMGGRGSVFLSLKGCERLRGEILTHQRLFGPGQINPEALWTETQKPRQALFHPMTESRGPPPGGSSPRVRRSTTPSQPPRRHPGRWAYGRTPPGPAPAAGC